MVKEPKIDKRKNPNNTKTQRQCSICKRVLDKKLFPSTNTKTGREHSYCRECKSNLQSTVYLERREEIANNRARLKRECAEKLGGKCIRCGYEEFFSALDFHHINDDKDNIVANLVTKAMWGNKVQITALWTEVDKCVLLCSNCHKALHAGEWEYA